MIFSHEYSNVCGIRTHLQGPWNLCHNLSLSFKTTFPFSSLLSFPFYISLVLFTFSFRHFLFFFSSFHYAILSSFLASFSFLFNPVSLNEYFPSPFFSIFILLTFPFSFHSLHFTFNFSLSFTSFFIAILVNNFLLLSFQLYFPSPCSTFLLSPSISISVSISLFLSTLSFSFFLYSSYSAFFSLSSS